MRANIIQPNPPERVAQVLVDALKIVAGLELDGELRGIAFTEAIRLLGVSAIMSANEVAMPLGLKLAGMPS